MRQNKLLSISNHRFREPRLKSLLNRVSLCSATASHSSTGEKEEGKKLKMLSDMKSNHW